MKKRELDHVLRAAGRITGEKQFIIIGSQSLHGKYPDLPDTLVKSFEVDLMASKNADRTEWLNVIGVYSPFHESFGYLRRPSRSQDRDTSQRLERPAGESARRRYRGCSRAMSGSSRSRDCQICRASGKGYCFHASSPSEESCRAIACSRCSTRLLFLKKYATEFEVTSSGTLTYEMSPKVKRRVDRPDAR
jgi:hypothetical protein